MKKTLILLAMNAALASSAAFAHDKEKHEASSVTPGRDIAQATVQVDPVAADAIAVVERFSTALVAGELDKAAAELDPAVLILESGGAERSRDEYLGGHAKHDAEFLKAAQITLKQRRADATGDLAWVASESEIHAMKGADMLMVVSTETMVLRNTPQGWKIVHIHWSSRAQR